MYCLNRRDLFLGAASLAALGLISRARAASSSDDVPQDVLALTSAYNESGNQLFAEFAQKPGNFVFSPFSIGTAMAMALSGARGTTEQEMLRVLKQSLARPQIEDASEKTIALLRSHDRSSDPHLCPQNMHWTGERCESQPVDGKCPPFARLDEAKCLANPDLPMARLLVANALFMARVAQSGIRPDYISLVREKFTGEIFHDATVEQVNDWVRRKTEGKIDGILDTLPSSDAALLNAVYFQAAWAQTFKKSGTSEDDFNLSSGTIVKVPMMHRIGTFAFVPASGYRAIRLPFSDSSFSFIVVLPEKIDGLSEVEKQFSTAEQTKLFESLADSRPKDVKLALPRFKVSFQTNLVDPFRNAGLMLPFSKEKADFSGMVDKDFSAYIDDIRHRAIVDVTEGGVAAAAVTAVSVHVMISARVGEPKYESFVVDRPFLFFILDETTRAVLFSGRISDPTKSA